MSIKAIHAVVTLAGAIAIGLAGSDLRAADPAAHGEYLARIMDCGGCHTPGALTGQPDMSRYLAGAEVGFEIPGLGLFYPPNLTSDRETGLGAWSEEDLILAIRTGERPDGRELAPVMPWRSYAALSDDDARALARYLKSLPPVVHRSPALTGPGETSPAPYLTVVVPKP